MEPTLTELADKYGTDKGTKHARGAFGPLNYTPFYEKLFAARREDKLVLLEIGVAEGASLRMWRDYFPNATIVGIDLRPVPPVPGCHIYNGINQGSAVDMANLAEMGPFDIVIDDGSHLFQHQLLSFGYLYPALAKGGLYCIEDLQAPDNRDEARNFFACLEGAVWEDQRRIVVMKKGGWY